MLFIPKAHLMNNNIYSSKQIQQSTTSSAYHIPSYNLIYSSQLMNTLSVPKIQKIPPAFLYNSNNNNNNSNNNYNKVINFNNQRIKTSI
jgi:hypothetical protein